MWWPMLGRPAGLAIPFARGNEAVDDIGPQAATEERGPG